ncbi:MAG: DUF6502 family protein [Rhodobacteraceae bacterium]|nr:DUF6502 family protein [Paracoccaceae bacterium]
MSRFESELGTGKLAGVLPALLRPLVRLLISRGVTFPMLQRMLKTLYVDCADSDFRISATAPTDSRISLLTGVHRRDVREIRSGERDTDEARQATTLVASVVGRWLADPDLTDAEGRPRALPRKSPRGTSFETLVQSVNRDVRPRTVLDELVRQKLVTESAGGFLSLRPDAAVGPSDSESQLVFFADNLGDHLSAAAANLDSVDPPFFERAVFYNRLTDASVDEIEQEARTLSAELLVRINALAAARQAADKDDATATERFRLGVFHYRSDGTARAPGDETED